MQPIYSAVFLIFILISPSLTNSFFSRLQDFYFGEESHTNDKADGNLNKEYQVVFLPALLSREAQNSEDAHYTDGIGLDYNFDAFGRNFDLKLIPNKKLLSPHFEFMRRVDETVVVNEELSMVNADCHYLHRGKGSVAAISACKDKSLHGLIFIDNSTFELRPLNSDDASAKDLDSLADYGFNDQQGDRIPHIIRKAPPLPDLSGDSVPLRDVTNLLQQKRSHKSTRKKRRSDENLTLELALFLDEAAYNIFYPHLDHNEKEMRDMLLAYMNGVQALYHHPSLGRSIDLSLVRMELMKTQPYSLPSHGGERSLLLDSFCEFQSRLNIADDNRPEHWDMAVLISGLDFYAIEGGRRSEITMGLAPVGGVCLQQHSCVIAEFGTTNAFGRPYPSAGFTSVYILAHEIGHNLGMHHDGTGNPCSKDGFIMSPSRGTSGETVWSSCSAEVVADLEWAKCLHDKPTASRLELVHDGHSDRPGVVWNAKRQCEILLRDHDAVPASKEPDDICKQLECRSPHRAGFYFAGPALQGTACGLGKWCDGGYCINSGKNPTKITSSAGVSYGWSVWKETSCQSGCTQGSRGYRERRRKCVVPSGVESSNVCPGTSYDVLLCDDAKLCAKKTREKRNEWASRRCAELSKVLPVLDARGYGLQAPHDQARLWMGCAVFCRRMESGGYYSPRVELNDLGADPYFPDGTWCHYDGTQDYFCLQHHCLPENFKLTAELNIWELPGDDIKMSFNARAREDTSGSADIKEPIKRYLSLDESGAPLLRTLPDFGADTEEETEEDWENKDYIEIPFSLRNADKKILS